MTKISKLNKRGLIIIGLIVILIILVLFFSFGIKDEKKTTTTKVETKEITKVVKENEVLKVELYQMVDHRNYSEKYQEATVAIEKGEEILGYKIAKDESFTKIMQLLPPDENSPLLNQSSQSPSHNAYILVLIGDIVEYENEKGTKTYQVVNGQVSYYCQSLLLESDYNSVYIASIDGKKEKMVKINEYQAALSSPVDYMSMLMW